MIANRYQIIDILKQTQQKSILRVQQWSKDSSKKQLFIAKRFALKSISSQQRYFNNELHLLNVVLKDSFNKGFPELKDVLKQKEFSYLIISELGENLQYLRKRSGGRLTLKTVLMIGLQLLQRLEHLHSRGYVHGDIQPGNFVVGNGKMSHKIYLLDYQFSVPYIINEKHISEQVIDNFTGSIRLCSLNANNYKNISRKDDLESVIYSMIYLIKGSLPWFQLKSQTLIEAYDETAKIKKDKVHELLEGLPQTFDTILNYVKGLKFEEKPNYEKIKQELEKLMKRNGYEMDYKFDWTYV